MRITSQNTDFSVKQSATPTMMNNTAPNVDVSTEQLLNQPNESTKDILSLDKTSMKEKLEPAIDTINEILETTTKEAKFVLHEGLDKYFVRLVDSKTEEVIKEIPPESLLNAFYELQKLAGMIVDEKI